MVLTLLPIGTRVPKLRAHIIDESVPMAALNVDNESMDLSPVAGLGTGQAIAKAGELRSMYQVGDSWFYWTSSVEVDLIKSQITSNLNRFYFTGKTMIAPPTYTAPQSSREGLANAGAESGWPSYSRQLGVTPPVDPITITIYGDEDENEDDVVVSYVYTYLTNWDEESAPNEVSTVTTIPGGQYVSIKGIVDPDIAHVTKIRVYRLESTDTGSADYMAIRVRAGSIAGTQYWDVPLSVITSENFELFDCNKSVGPDALREAGTDVIPSETWAVPPASMHNLTQHFNGMLIGSFDNVLCISEPLVPYAWPVEYRKTFEYDIVALGVLNSAIIVLTEAYPFVVQGSSPLGMVSTRIEQRVGCVSKRGVVSSRFGVLYPGPDGLYLVDGYTATNITSELYTSTQWAALGPENLVGFMHNDTYYGFFLGSDYCIQLEYSNGKISLYEVECGIDIYGGYIEPIENELWLLGKNEGVYKRYKWGGATSDLSYTWQTKNFKTHPTNVEVLQIISPFDQGAITVTVLYDWDESQEVSGDEYTVSDTNFIWLKGEQLYRSIAFVFEGKSKIEMVKFADSPEELASG